MCEVRAAKDLGSYTDGRSRPRTAPVLTPLRQVNLNPDQVEDRLVFSAHARDSLSGIDSHHQYPHRQPTEATHLRDIFGYLAREGNSRSACSIAHTARD